MPEVYSSPKTIERHTIQSKDGDLASTLMEASEWLKSNNIEEDWIQYVNVDLSYEGGFVTLVFGVITKEAR